MGRHKGFDGAGRAAADGYERLISRALAELDAAAQAAEQGRLVRTYSVQLLLALLFDGSDGDRAPFDAFLRHACDEHGFTWAADTRAAAIREAWRGIRQSVDRGTAPRPRPLRQDRPASFGAPIGDPFPRDRAPPTMAALV